MVVTKDNYFQMLELVKYADSLETKYLNFTTVNLASATNIEDSYSDFYKSIEFRNAVTNLELAEEKYKNVNITKDFSFKNVILLMYNY